MKRCVRSFVMMLLIFSLFFCAMPMSSKAAFSDLKKYGANFNLKAGNWIAVYSKIPGKSGLTKFYAKITKYRLSEYPAPKTSGSSSSSQSMDTTMTAVMTIQVQYPKRPSRQVAGSLMRSGHDFIDYLDVVVVDKNTGENLNTSETSEDGTNYHGVSVSETEWKGLKPQKLSWSNGTVYQYYISYVKTVVIKFPTGYRNTCVGICGSHVGDYQKMLDWNEGFMEGYTAFSDTTHVKLGSKKKTSKLSHFFNIKKKEEKTSTTNGNNSGNSNNTKNSWLNPYGINK
ncbi:hypothetical protein [Butyrivibrio sp. AE3004]|uniref:hypothetical protein n=1 Tax=Butyrivibrio sp. AE3004 TaxID=1506994 RepID=UPI000493F195|nr:hypothetical protein [Butyrivibrio sp. AE3004]